MLRIKARVLLASGYGMFHDGAEGEVPDAVARAWVAAGVADPVGWLMPPEPPKKTAKPETDPAWIAAETERTVAQLHRLAEREKAAALAALPAPSPEAATAPGDAVNIQVTNSFHGVKPPTPQPAPTAAKSKAAKSKAAAKGKGGKRGGR